MTIVWTGWAVLLVTLALTARGVDRLIAHLPERLPLLVSVSPPTPPDVRQNLEAQFVASGADYDYVSKETALQEIQALVGTDAVLHETTVLSGLTGNPLQDLYIVRCSNPSTYASLASHLSDLHAPIRIHHDLVTLNRLAPAFRLARGLACAVLILGVLLFWRSAAGHLSDTGILRGAGVPDSAWRDTIGVALRGAAGALLISVAVMGGLLSILGYAAARNPNGWVAPYAEWAGRLLRGLDINGPFLLAMASGWFLIILAACVSRGVSPPRPDSAHSAGHSIPGYLYVWMVSLTTLLGFGLGAAVAAPPSGSSRAEDLQAVHEDVMKQIRARENEYEREQMRLRQTQQGAAALAKKERQVLKKLETADRDLSKTRSELTVVGAQLEALRADIETTERNWLAEHLSQEERRLFLSIRLQSLHLWSRRSDWLGHVLVFGDRKVFHAVERDLIQIVSTDQALIDQIGRRKVEIEQNQTLLAAKNRSLTDVQEKKRTLEIRQSRERQTRERLLGEVRGRKSAMDELARRLEEEQSSLQLLLTTLREQASKLREQLAYLKKEFEDKKGLLRWPIPASSIQSVRRYGKFFDETISAWRVNKGIDIQTETNQSVVAVSRGEVVFADYFGRMGNLVILSHGGDYFTLYAHLSEIGVTLGRRVESSDALGRAGNTGLLESSPVLHFEIRQGGQALDPEDWLGRRSSR